MNTILSTIIGMAVLLMTTLGDSRAWAGAIEIEEVRLGSNWAAGGMVATRHSSDNSQYIDCDNRSGLSAGKMRIYCNAKDKNNSHRSCTASNPKFLEPLRTLTDASHISFYVDERGNCTHINVRNGSSLLK